MTSNGEKNDVKKIRKISGEIEKKLCFEEEKCSRKVKTSPLKQYKLVYATMLCCNSYYLVYWNELQ
jgi:hypothetical protein